MDDDEVSYWVRIGHIAGATRIASEIAEFAEQCDAEGGLCEDCQQTLRIAEWILGRVAEQAKEWEIQIIQNAPTSTTMQ